jgi:UDP-arabinose 4-epimerase
MRRAVEEALRMAKVLVTGGAGYIGSHTVKALGRAGHEVAVLDDLSEGHRAAIRSVPIHEGNVGDRAFVDAVLAAERPDAVVHFAAHCYVGESVTAPGKYWRNNAVATLSLLEALIGANAPVFLFSSTCAVYGEPKRGLLREDLPRLPVNPYGRTKAAVEWMLEDFHRAHGLRYASLRYFNAAGADPEGDLGEDHDPETHLVPLVIREALRGEGSLRVFGTDYPTPDGTCVRDYVHVTDLADAHVRAVGRLLSGGEPVRVNLGTGRGHSVLEVIRAVSERAGRPVPYAVVERRPGDPARLVARPGRARTALGWRPRHSGLPELVDTAWRWHEAHPEGYGE